LPVPFGPLQARSNWVVLVSAAVDSLPEVALVPDQPPEAVQDVAFVEDQLRVDDSPLKTDAGFAASETVGAGGPTVTVAVALCVPPDPVHERLKVLVIVSAPELSLPEVAFAPDQAPDALQNVASVEDQVSVEDPPLATDGGLAASETVGAGAGGGVPATATSTEELALPPRPVQVREKLLLVPSGPVSSLPEVALTPDHAPLAEQEVELVDDQVRVELSPLASDAGFAWMSTVGTAGRASLPPSPAPPAGSISLALHAASASASTATRRFPARKVWLLTP
jgi:hypothetical protein